MLKKLSPYIILTLVAIMVFAGGLFTSKDIVSGDNRPSEAATYLRILEHSTGNWGWNSTSLTGGPANPIPFYHRVVAMKLFSPGFYLKFMYFISILLAGIFFYIFIKDYELSEIASIFGAAAWMLTSSIITLINPGHLGKLMALSWLPLSFLFIRRAVTRNLWSNYVYAGFFTGLSFLGKGYQMSLYFGFLLCFYWLYLLLRKRGDLKLIPFIKTKWKTIGKHKAGIIATGMIILLVTAILIPSFQRQTEQRKHQSSLFHKNGKQKWKWATQWSLPIPEIIDFAIPGLFGWKTGDRTHPYLGKLGRGGGLHNLKLNSENIGLTTALFMIMAIFLLWKTRNSEHRFWFWTMIIALALSLGKYLHLPYYLFYKLPFMDSIRNPNKFVKLVAFAAVILAAHGFHAIFSEREKYAKKIKSIIRGTKILAIFFAGLSLLSIILKKVIIDIIRTPKVPLGKIENVATYYPVAFLIAAATTGIIWYVLRLTQDKKIPSGKIRLYSCLLVALVIGELWYTAGHFIEYYKHDLYNEDRLTAAFTANNNPSRVFFTGRNFFLDKFKYYGINSLSINRLRIAEGRIAPLAAYINSSIASISKKYQSQYRTAAAAIPRDDQQKAREAMQKLARDFSGKLNLEINTLFMKAGSAVGATHVITMLNVSNTIFDPAFQVRLPVNTRRGQKYLPHTVFRKKAAEAAKLSMRYRYSVHSSDKDVVHNLLATALTAGAPLRLLQNDLNAAGNPPLPAPVTGTNEPSYSVALREYKNNRIRGEVYTAAPGLLYIPDQYHKYWNVMIDGKPGKIIPANLIGRAVPLPKGKHTIEFQFKAPCWPLNISLLGFFLTFLVFATELYLKRRKKKQSPQA